ncbi:MAG: DUF7024 domain-containing protein [Enterocloster bolteae]
MAKTILNNHKRVLGLYFIVYYLIMLIITGINKPIPYGEYDDYTLTSISIINDHNFAISDDDLQVYKKIFPEWKANIDNNKALSGYFTSKGEELPWYFPTYSLVCVPMILILETVGIPAIYAFSLTNLHLLILMALVIFRCLQANNKSKFILIVTLTINPIVFYISWPSAEVLIFSLVALGMVFWYNGWYRRAAVAISVAGTLNVTILSVGFVMIAEYFYKKIFKKREKGEAITHLFKRMVLRILSYGSCYIIGIVPLIYNYYYSHNINLTASYKQYTMDVGETVAERFWAYLFDLNFGMAPYYSFMIIAGLIIAVFCIIKRNWRFFIYILAFTINVILYSNINHINCGMSGIARYNAWCIVMLIVPICLYGDEVLGDCIWNKIYQFLVVFNTVILIVIIHIYNPVAAKNTSSLEWTPIARYVLDNLPGIYNPLYSTFNSRISHVDGGYVYETPIIYSAKDGYVRKVLASCEDIDNLLSNYKSFAGFNDLWEGTVKSLEKSKRYISVPAKYKIAKCLEYKVGDCLYFDSRSQNVGDFVVSGLSRFEDWGAWTDGNEFIMRFRTLSESKTLHAQIKGHAYNGARNINVYINNVNVFSQAEFTEGNIEFDFINPGKNSAIEMRIEIPNAMSPSELGDLDNRTLGLGITSMIFTEGSEIAIMGKRL